MNFRPSLAIAATLLPLVAGGCTDRVFADDDGFETGSETETETETETGTDPSGSETDDGTESETDTDTDEPEATDCGQLCAAPVEGSCLSVDACVSECETRTPGWPPELVEAFATCVATDPLCFVTLDSCLLGQLHPQGTPMPLRLTGAEFHAYEGATVHAFYDQSPELEFSDNATIVAGGFEFEWTEPVWANAESGPSIGVWVDVDDDQACTAADLAQMVTLVWNGDLLAPAWSLDFVPAVETNEFVCTLAP